MNTDPKWLAEAIEAAALGIHGGSIVTEDHYRRAGNDAIRAALPVIREGLAKEIETDQIAKTERDGWALGYNSALYWAARIVRSEP